jgi:septal ring factor EnvC (AmiA/AmiB activator)
MERELSSLQEELLEKIDILRLMERKNETLDRERKSLKVNLREVELKIGRILKRRDELNEGLENLNLHEI